MKHWKYLKYVLRHKLYVYQAGRELRVGRVQLVVHDFQKFLPSEWFPYVETFYGNDPKPDSGFFSDSAAWEAREMLRQRAFDKAWLHHQKLGGKHHWQYWLLPLDDGRFKALPMPDKYRREMLADWRGAGRAIHGHDETASWYQKNKSNMQLHPRTRAWIEKQLGALSPE